MEISISLEQLEHFMVGKKVDACDAAIIAGFMVPQDSLVHRALFHSDNV